MQAKLVFDLLHVDLLDPYKTPIINGCYYFSTLVDDYSRFVWAVLMHDKSVVCKIIEQFLLWCKPNSKPKLNPSELTMVLNL